LLTKEKKHHQIGKTNNILKKNMEGESQVPWQTLKAWKMKLFINTDNLTNVFLWFPSIVGYLEKFNRRLWN
jgi:hypothetical protein